MTVVRVRPGCHMTPSLQITGIHLRTRALAPSVEFYTRQLGFTLAGESGSRVQLATAPGQPPILTITERHDAVQPPSDAAGLFHAALLFSSRSGLGSWLRFAAAQDIDFEGFSDHGVSEAIYLSDPDGNGLEFYADRPRSAWPWNGPELAMTTRPLDVRDLLAAATITPASPLADAAWGHLHLRVTDLDRSEAYYCRAFGMDVMQRSFPGARFLAADGYHHHLGLHTWGGPRVSQPANAVGLVDATFSRRGQATESMLVDPDGIHIRLQSALVLAQNV